MREVFAKGNPEHTPSGKPSPAVEALEALGRLESKLVGYGSGVVNQMNSDLATVRDAIAHPSPRLEMKKNEWQIMVDAIAWVYGYSASQTKQIELANKIVAGLREHGYAITELPITSAWVLTDGKGAYIHPTRDSAELHRMRMYYPETWIVIKPSEDVDHE